MSKQLTITRDQMQENLQKLGESAKIACDNLRRLLSENRDVLDILRAMRFEQVGCDPLNPGRALNLTEQLNQTFTYLASFEGARILFDNHPDVCKLTLNLGTKSGSDIETSECGGIAAEVFAAVDPDNNGKLQKDVEKVRKVPNVMHRYVFYISPKKSGRTYSDVKVIHLNNPLNDLPCLPF